MRIVTEIITTNDLEIQLYNERKFLEEHLDHLINKPNPSMTDMELLKYVLNREFRASDLLVRELKIERSRWKKFLSNRINFKRRKK